MRAFAVLSTVAITAALAVAIPGSVTENTAMASTTDCAVAHTPVMPIETTEGSNIYNIQSAANLVYLSVNQDLGDPKWRTRNFVQTASIDLQGCTWTPIGRFLEENEMPEDEMPFTGTFNGGGHPINNLRIESLSYSGLFGFTDRAEIAGVRLVDANVTVGRISSTLVGLAERTNISDSSATGSVSGTGDGIGGLVGQAAFGSTIDRSFSAVSVTRTSGSGLAYGGLVGSLSESSIANSHATGAVSAGGRAGGLVGEAGLTSTISNSYSRGAVTGASGVGGLIGFLPTPTTLTVTNSYATGAVTGNSGDGGLIGDKAASNVTLTVTNSFWDTTTTHLTTTLDNQGAGRDTEDMTSIATFTDTASPDLNQAWPIVEGWQSFNPTNNRVWGIRSDLNDGYPFLLWEYETPFGVTCNVMHGIQEPALQDGSFIIASVQNLVYLSEKQNDNAPGTSDLWRTQDFVQTAPIDLEGCLWTPIGERSFQDKGFLGTYDGGGFSISNLYTNQTTQTGINRRLGLFGGIGDSDRDIEGEVRRVTLINAIVESDSPGAIGTLAGQNYGTIEFSTATGEVTGTSQAAALFSGGLVGLTGGPIRQSSSYANVLGPGLVGGLVGGLASPLTIGGVRTAGGSVSSSYAAGNVTSSGEQSLPDAGGLVGRALADTFIENSYASGRVQGTDLVGGFAGRLDRSVTLSTSYSLGDVSGDTNVGGFIGQLQLNSPQGPDPQVTNSFWSSDTSNQQTSAGGTVKSSEQLQAFDTFATANWAITDGWEPYNPPDAIWGICDDTVNGGYPFLLWQFSEHPCPQTPEPAGESGPQPAAKPGAGSDGSAKPSTESLLFANDQQDGSVDLNLIPRASSLEGSDSEDASNTLQDADGESPAVTDVTGDTDGAGGDTVASDQSPDGQASALASETGGTGWLWAIGLGGLGAAALIAGGVAFARMRP